MTKQEKLDFVHNFVLTLAEEGEAFFTSGDVEQDYDLIKGTIDNQGYWAGTKYRYFFDSEYKLSHLEQRRFGQ